MRLRLRACFGVFALIITLSVPVTANDNTRGLDTTRVRETKKIKKTTGEIIADIPGEIVKLPVYTIKFVSYGIAFGPVTSKALSLIDFTAPARRYVPVAGYSPSAGLKLGFGLRKLKKDFWDDRLEFNWYYSTNDYQSYKFRYKAREIIGTRRLEADLYFRYKKRPRESFYGIGMDAKEDKEANYTFENTEFRLDIPVRIHPKITAGVTGGVVITNVYDGRDPDLPGNIDSIMADPDFALEEGRLDGSRYIKAGLIFAFDGRDSGGQPSKGFHVLSRFVRYFGTDRSEDENFYETKIDFRHYLNVFKKRILATRFYIQRFDADNNNKRATPIHLTSRMGGFDGARGYAKGRYHDNDIVLASVEWRFPVWEILDGYVFLDEGRVYEQMPDEAFFRDWKYSAGFGLRIWNVNTVSLSTLVAASDEGARFYIETGAAW